MKVTLTRVSFLASLVVLFISLNRNNSFAQNNIETAAQMVEIGDGIFNKTLAITEAREYYINAVNLDADNVRANYMAGVTTLQSIDKGTATEYFLRVLELDPEYSFDVLYKIGTAYHYDYKFDSAINYYSQYKKKLTATNNSAAQKYATLDEVNRKLYECEQGRLMIEYPENVKIINLGGSINSPGADYAPVLNRDETMLIFTSRRQNSNLNPNVSYDNYPFEDIFVSTKLDTRWQQAQNIGKPINTLHHDSNVGLSKDGATLFIYKDDNGGDIFEAQLEANGKWSEPKPMGPPINTIYAETTVSLTPDGQTLFFASDREGGYGGLDIWLTTKNNEGEWEDPINLGGEINTPMGEDGPFIGYDGKTLYFSSRGGEGMGGFDIYRVVYDSLSRNWTVPENMGYPINSPDHDIYFVPTKDGKNAYYSSVREGGFGDSDIYMLKIPEVLHHKEIVTEPNVNVLVKIFDDKNNLVDASIRLKPIDGSSTIPPFRKSQGQYNFFSRHPEARQVQLTATRSGFEAQELSFVIPHNAEKSMQLEKSITLIKRESTMAPTVTNRILRNIYFDFNKSVINNQYRNLVVTAVEYLKSHPAEELLLVGHADLIGTEKYNLNLSIKRADNVKKAIVAKGIAPKRIQTEGKGYKNPLASNADEKDGRELNRRVEFRVIR